MDEEQIITAIEILNRQYQFNRSSKEYEIGRKLMRFIKEIKRGQFTMQIERFKKKRRLNKIEGIVPTDNVDELTWKKNLRPGKKETKVVVYSCITGNYDKPKKPVYYPDNIDYILYLSDTSMVSEPCGWTVLDIPDNISNIGDNAMINRYIKFHPHELFGEMYDLAIYIDGNITPVSDLSIYAEVVDENVGIAMHKHCSRDCIYEEIKACFALGKGDAVKLQVQNDEYKKKGFPTRYGMLECNVIVTDLNNGNAVKLLEQWWNELCRSKSGRDQIALPFILWKNGINVSNVAKLGNNVYQNTKLQITNHI